MKAHATLAIVLSALALPCASAQSLGAKRLETGTLQYQAPPTKADTTLYEQPKNAPAGELTHAKGKVISRSGDTVLIQITHPITAAQSEAIRQRKIERAILYPDSQTNIGAGHTAAPGFSGNHETICIRDFWRKSLPTFDGQITRDGTIVVSGKTLRAYLWKQ